MNDDCATLHVWFNELRKFYFPFEKQEIPKNGIYILFEKGEFSHSTNRIVRIGSHTGNNKLNSRLEEHFVKENKDRSIFRKHIGRALLNKANDPFLEMWEIDLTSKEARDKYSSLIDLEKLKQVEKEVTKYIQENFWFVVFPVEDKSERLYLEKRIISTVSLCGHCTPSKNWLGNYSPNERIRKSGLWLVNELWKTPLSENEMIELGDIIEKSM